VEVSGGPVQSSTSSTSEDGGDTAASSLGRPPIGGSGSSGSSDIGSNGCMSSGGTEISCTTNGDPHCATSSVDESVQTEVSTPSILESNTSIHTEELHLIGLRLTLAVMSDDIPGARQLAAKLMYLASDTREAEAIESALSSLTAVNPSREHEKLAAVLGALFLKVDADGSDDDDEDDNVRYATSIMATTRSSSDAASISCGLPTSPGAHNYPRELNLAAQRQMSKVSIRRDAPSREPLAEEAPIPRHSRSSLTGSVDFDVSNLIDTLDDATASGQQIGTLLMGDVKGVEVVIAGTPGDLLIRAIETLQAVHSGSHMSLIDRVREIESAVAHPTDLLEGIRQLTDPDHIFLDVFFLAFRIYHTPEHLADQLLDLLSTETIDVRTGVLACATHWVTFYWCDFLRDPVLKYKVQLLHRTALASLFNSPQAQHLVLEQVEQCHILSHVLALQTKQTAPQTCCQSEVFGPTENVVVRLQPRSIAEQLTLLNHNLINRIHPVEYVLYYFPGDARKPVDVAPNLEAAIRRFDAESYWVAAEILFPRKSRERAALVAKFIRVAGHCLELGNFFSLFSILGALCFPEISRLKSVWEKVPEKVKRKQSNLELVMNPSRNMKAYRDRLRSFDTVARVPFLPLHLKDLVFANEAGKTWRKLRVNFEKMILVARCVLPVTSIHAYDELEMDHALQTYFRVSIVTSLDGTSTATSSAATTATGKSVKGSTGTMAAMRQAIKDSFLRSRSGSADEKAERPPRKSFWRDRKRIQTDKSTSSQGSPESGSRTRRLSESHSGSAVVEKHVVELESAVQDRRSPKSPTDELDRISRSDCVQTSEPLVWDESSDVSTLPRRGARRHSSDTSTILQLSSSSLTSTHEGAAQVPDESRCANVSPTGLKLHVELGSRPPPSFPNALSDPSTDFHRSPSATRSFENTSPDSTTSSQPTRVHTSRPKLDSLPECDAQNVHSHGLNNSAVSRASSLSSRSGVASTQLYRKLSVAGGSQGGGSVV
jgi:hypothetical protein